MALANAIPLSEYLTLPAHTSPWLIQPLIPAGGIVCLHGHAKTRKSFLAIQMARDICNGDRFLGFESKPGTVLYVQLDTPRSLWQLRFQGLVRDGLNLTPEGGSRLWLADTENAPYPFHILTPQVQQWMRQQIDLIQPDLVIFDVIRKMFKGNDNDSDMLEDVISTVKHTCRPAAVLMIAHSKKAKADFDSGTIGEIRGSSAQGASYDTILRLQKATKTAGPILSIEGRAIEDQEIHLVSQPNLLFGLGRDTMFDVAVKDALAQPFPSERQRAEHLAAVTGASFDKCHSALRRARPKILS